jgi:sugar/nucleoside kinase (ribokinase family)
VRICTLGDLLLDVIVRLDQPLAGGADAPAATRAGAGGQAANVAAWAADLGAECRFIGKRADDMAGRLAAEELAERGVDVVGPVVAGRNGVVVSLVELDGERTMATDRGVAPDLPPEELEETWLDGCSHLHLSGYSLLRSPIDEAAARAVKVVRVHRASVSVDLSSWSAIRDFGARRLRRRLEALAPDVLFANERERETLGGELPAETRVLKRGAAGCLIVGGDERLELAAVPAEVVDSTGAGDALAAGFLLGGSLEEAGRRGLEAAARCLSKLGAMP